MALDASPLALTVEPPGAAALALVALDAGRSCANGFAPMDSLSRELRPGASFGADGTLTVAPNALPQGVERLVLVAFTASERGRIPLTELAIASDGWRFAPEMAGRRETAVLLIDIYRHGEGWRLSANGQGFVEGLDAVARTFRIDTAWVRRFEAQSPDRVEAGVPRRTGAATGSAVAVDAHHVLTNAHVVEDAHTVAVSGDAGAAAASCVFADPRNDLALLRVERPMADVARFRSGLDLHLGEDVTVLGFPLQGLLGTGLQASAGNVARLTGLGNDSGSFQFTAPIASGNSGGPIVDLSGHVVGLVCASLDLEHVRRAGGSAENVNFGIKAAMIRSFLDAAGVAPVLAADEPPLGRAAVVRRMRGVLYRVACTC